MNWRALLGPAESEPLRVLALLESAADRHAFGRIGATEHWRIDFVNSVPTALALLTGHKFTAIVCDRDGAEPDWRSALDSLVCHAGGAAVILASSVKDDRLWQEVVRRGGYDVITKPFREDLLIRSIRFAGSTK